MRPVPAAAAGRPQDPGRGTGRPATAQPAKAARLPNADGPWAAEPAGTGLRVCTSVRACDACCRSLAAPLAALPACDLAARPKERLLLSSRKPAPPPPSTLLGAVRCAVRCVH